MSDIYTITIGFGPAVMIARSLILYKKYRSITPKRHIVALAKFPINTRKNENDIRLICDAIGDIDIIDIGEDIGSAQSQNFILKRIGIKDDDYFLNLDGDSASLNPSWDHSLKLVLDNDKNCILVSLMSPMVQRYLTAKNETLMEVQREHVPRYGIPKTPTPFNLSLWRYSFFKEIGGVPQLGFWWGETEAPTYSAAKSQGKYHAYLLDIFEDEKNKWMQDRQHNEYKDAHMRVPPLGQDRFYGKFSEYLRLYYPALAEMDTCKDLLNDRHP